MGAGASTTYELAQASEDVAIQAVKELDVDSSDSLTVKEIKAGVAKRGAAIRADWPDKLIEKTVRLYDTDKDGCLNRAEFCAALRDMEERKPPKPSAVRRLFHMMDQDGNGQIDRIEACLVADALQISPDSFWNVLSKYGKKVPNKIAYTEFADAMKGKIFIEFFRSCGYKSHDVEGLCQQAISKLAQHPDLAHLKDEAIPDRTWSFKKVQDDDNEFDDIKYSPRFSVGNMLKQLTQRKAVEAAQAAEAQQKGDAASSSLEETSSARRSKQAAEIKSRMATDGMLQQRVQAKLTEAENAIALRLKQKAEAARAAALAEEERAKAEADAAAALAAERDRKAAEWIAAEKAKKAPEREAKAEAEAAELERRKTMELEAERMRREEKLAEMAAETRAAHEDDARKELKHALGDVDPDYKAPAPRLHM